MAQAAADGSAVASRWHCAGRVGDKYCELGWGLDVQAMIRTLPPEASTGVVDRFRHDYVRFGYLSPNPQRLRIRLNLN